MLYGKPSDRVQCAILKGFLNTLHWMAISTDDFPLSPPLYGEASQKSTILGRQSKHNGKAKSMHILDMQRLTLRE